MIAGQAAPNSASEDEGSVDIEKAIELERQSIQNEIKPANGDDQSASKFQKLFSSLKTQMDSIIFIQFHPDLDPLRICHALLTDTKNSQKPKTRHVNRIHPLKTCPAKMEGIEKLLDEQVKATFASVSGGTWRLQPRIRHCHHISRQKLIKSLATRVQAYFDSTDKGSDFKVQLNGADWVIVVEVVQVCILIYSCIYVRFTNQFLVCGWYINST